MICEITKQILGMIVVMTIVVGCVGGQISQRRGDKAYRYGDYQTAVTEYTEAVEGGNIDAMYHLGAMYAEGQGVPKDLTKAASLVRQAAEGGQEDAMLMYGLFNVYGDGVPINPTEGIRWLTMAAAQDNDVAMYYLGILYAMGLGVDMDTQAALVWMTKAKENGFPVKDALLSEEGLAELATE